MNYFEKRLNEALNDDIPEVPDEEPVWNIRQYIDDLEERDPGVERLLLATDDIKTAFYYAKKFFKGVGWPGLEEKIADNSNDSLMYALFVLDGKRFPLGESAIAANPWDALAYARHVVKGEWPQGEEAIFSDPSLGKSYRKFLKDHGT